MIRVLAIIAGIGLVMSAVCIASAIAIGGPDALVHGAWTFGRGNWSGSGGVSEDHWRWGRFRRHFAAGPVESRDFAWTGAHDLAVDAPADIDFHQADGPPKLTISAPASVLGAVRVDGGEISLESGGEIGRLHITLTAPAVDRFELRGEGRLNITGYKQDQLTIALAGHGDVAAEGQTKAVNLDISGAGAADFARLRTAGADISISGAGHATVGPTDWAKLQIAGVGDVNLLTRPPHLETHIEGAGQVHMPPEPGSGPSRAI